MGNTHIKGLGTIVFFTRRVCKALNKFLPAVLPFVHPVEAAALVALQQACSDLLALEPLPGTDSDPGTPE